MSEISRKLKREDKLVGCIRLPGVSPSDRCKSCGRDLSGINVYECNHHAKLGKIYICEGCYSLKFL